VLFANNQRFNYHFARSVHGDAADGSDAGRTHE
jgi:hypothetical protein